MALTQSAGQRRVYVLIWGLAMLGLVNQYPGLGEIHVALQLPLIAVQVGVILAHIFADMTLKRDWIAEHVGSIGLAIGVLAIIGFNVATSYIPSPVGFRKIIGIDDLRPISDWIAQNASPGDTLYVIPSTDSNPQIHVLTRLLPPHTYTIVNKYVLSAPFVSEKLLAEWERHPPTWIVYFPEMAQEDIPPTAQPLITFIHTRYTMQHEFPDLPFYGSAQVLHVRDISEQ